jgi:uncharacterized protein
MPEFSDYAPGTPSWVDLGSPDVEASARFYGELLGWEAVEAGPPEATGGYQMFLMGGKQVAGLGPLQQEGQPPAWTTYLATAGAEDTAHKATAAGGRVFVGPFEVLDSGRMAIIADPTGAVFGVWEAGSHHGAQLANEPGSLCWNELATRDMEAARRFYGEVFGWEGVTRDYAGSPYTEWQLDGRTVAGGREMGPEFPPDVPPYWGVCFAVSDCDDAVARAQSLGASVSMAPTTIPAGRFAVLVDPQGAAFSIIDMEAGSSG